MSSPSLKRPRRHDLVFVSRAGWHAALAARSDLSLDSLVALWVDRGWPLIGRRGVPGDLHGVPLGLPLPPSAGKRRLAFVVQPEDVVSTAMPPALRVVSRAAPPLWWATLNRLEALAARHAVEVRVCGSLAWQALTGMDYVTERSDIDLLLHVRRDTDVYRLTADLASIETAAPMRLDGELIRDDGAAVNWRELHEGAHEVLVKTVRGVALLAPRLFLPGSPPP